MGVLAPFVTRLATNGMVCAVDDLAAGAGVAMLRAGGTAADAAVAASAVLAVTAQYTGGMGGDLFALVHRSGDHRPAVLNASGRAGSGADPERLRAEGHRTMPFGGDIRSVPVPGCVDGWVALHERFGRLPLGEVLEPARRYAQEGFPTSATLALTVLLVTDVPGADDYVRDGVLQPGQVVRRPGVARALAAVAEDGRDGFYLGEFGEGLLALGAGEYEKEDLARVHADWVPALGLDAWGRTLWTVPPNSQGYLTLAASWIASELGLPNDPADPDWPHLLVEASRQAAHDRVAVLHEGADGAALLDPARLGPRRAAIRRHAAADLGHDPLPGDTTYLCAVDGDRAGVSLIQSNAFAWGAHIVEPQTRIFLHNRGIGFSLEPGHPAEYGPGRRPPHTLSPALVTGPDGRLDLVLGTMSGDSQPQVLLQLLARLLAGDSSPAEAVAAGRWTLAARSPGSSFDTWTEGGRVRVRVEGHAPEAWDDGLRSRGHDVERVAPFDHGSGHAHVIRVHDDHLAGAADPRSRGGEAAGW